MKRNENVTSIAKRLEKTGDISQRDADYVYSCFSEGYVNDAFVEAACRTLRRGKGGNCVSAFPPDVRFLRFLELLPWNLRKVIKAFQTNKPVYFVHESLVRTVMEYIRSITER